MVETSKLALYRVDLNVTFVLNRRKGQGGLQAIGGEERILYEAVEVVLICSLTFAIVPQRSETPTKAQLRRSTLQNYISPPFLGFQYGAVAFT